MVLKHVISLPTLADLKSQKGSENSVALISGRNSIGDGMGGLYIWKLGSATESLTFLEIVRVTGDTTGYWQRLLLSTRILPHGYLVSNGGVKSFFSTAPYATDANGLASINLTFENTTGGTPIFTEIWWNESRVVPPTTSTADANSIIRGDCRTQSADLRQTTHMFTRGNNQTISLLSLVSINILGSRVAPVGTQVQFLIQGI